MRSMMGILMVISLLLLGSMTMLPLATGEEMTRDGIVDLRPLVHYPAPGQTLVAEDGMRVNFSVENIGDIAANSTGYVSLKVKVPSSGDVVFNPFNVKLNFTGTNELGPMEQVTMEFPNWTSAAKGSYTLEVEIIYLDDNKTNDVVSFTIYVKSNLWPGPIDLSWTVDPPRGHTDDLFTYDVTYGFNTLPDLMIIQIDGENHTLVEKDPLDIFPDDGKDYFYSTYLDIGDHNYSFMVEVGSRNLNTSIISGPWVNITLRNPTVMPIAGYITSEFLFKVNYGSVDNDPPDEIFVEISDKQFNLTRETPTTNYVSANVEFRATVMGDQIMTSPMVMYFVCRTDGDEYRIGPVTEEGPRMEMTNLTGTVMDQDEIPLEGVLVELFPGGNTSTDAAGAYRLPTFIGLDFELRYTLEGYQNVYFTDIDMILPEDHYISPRMTLIPGGAVLEGHVMDERGALLEGVEVALVNLGVDLQFTTNSTGHFIFEDLPRIDGYTLSVESHIYEDLSQSIDLMSEGHLISNLTLEERTMFIYLDPQSGVVPVDQSFTLSFPRAINRSSLAFRISNSTDTLFATLTFGLNDTMVTLTPVEHLLYDSQYSITLEEGVEDNDGILVAWRPFTWEVITRKQPNGGLITYPANEEEGVPLDAEINLWFGIGLQQETFEYELTMRGGSGSGVPSNITYEEELNWTNSGARSVHITIEPDTLVYGTGYLLEIDGSLLDQYGRAVFTKSHSLEFRTRDEPDSDNDGVSDSNDLFPDDPNEWEDSDGDSIGDNADLFPLDGTEWMDTDGDGKGDGGDPDDDNDGLPDVWELANGLDPLDPADFDQDPDGDGHTNLDEYRADTDPQDKGSHPEDESGVDWALYGILILVVVGILAVVVFLLTRRKTPMEPGEE